MRRRFELADAETSLTELLDGIERLVVERTRSKAFAGEIRLMAEEALTNVMKYGYEEPTRPSMLAEVHLSVGASEVALEIRDRGTAFDPLSQPSPDLEAPLERKREGGLGIHLVRSFADEMAYEREGDENVLSLKKRMG